MSNNTMGLVVAAVLACGFAGNARAQVQPTFTGTWKMNPAKCEFGPLPGPQSRIDKIDHREPHLDVISTTVGSQGERTVRLNYTTDGKENTNTTAGAEMKSRLKWQGSALLIDSVVNMGGNAITIQDRWTLSDDGKTLTINRHMSSALGVLDQVQVLEKQ